MGHVGDQLRFHPLGPGAAVHGGVHAVLDMVQGLRCGPEIQNQVLFADLGAVIPGGNGLRTGFEPVKGQGHVAHQRAGDQAA